MLTVDKPYLSADVRAIGDSASDAPRGGLTKQQYRDAVTFARMEVIDIFYYKFESELTGSYNTLELSSDLAVLALNGIGATVGTKAAKAALAAASAGVVGAKSAVNTDVFYQKTLPALVAQMRAGRQTVLATIKTGLTKPAEVYSMDQALSDINAYYIAGTLPSAVSQITADAGATLASANSAIDALRVTTYAAPTSTVKRITAWLFPNGDATKLPIAANLASLKQWMQNDKTDPTLNSIPYALLLYSNDKLGEADRTRAITALGIP